MTNIILALLIQSSSLIAVDLYQTTLPYLSAPYYGRENNPIAAVFINNNLSDFMYLITNLGIYTATIWLSDVDKSGWLSYLLVSSINIIELLVIADNFELWKRYKRIDFSVNCPLIVYQF